MPVPPRANFAQNDDEEIVRQGDPGERLVVLLLHCSLTYQEDPVEWEDTHVRRREELVVNFQLAWNQQEAEWLAFPGTRHDGRRPNCN